jgi:hypothetical protein
MLLGRGFTRAFAPAKWSVARQCKIKHLRLADSKSFTLCPKIGLVYDAVLTLSPARWAVPSPLIYSTRYRIQAMQMTPKPQPELDPILVNSVESNPVSNEVLTAIVLNATSAALSPRLRCDRSQVFFQDCVMIEFKYEDFPAESG